MHLSVCIVLLYSNHRHVSATHVAIFRVVRARTQPVILICRNHSIVKKNRRILVKFTFKRVSCG